MLNEIALNVTAAQLETALRTPELLDTFTIAEGEEPVAFYQFSLSDQNWSKILIVGTIKSDDASSVNRQISIGTANTFQICRAQNEDLSKLKNFSITVKRMVNGHLQSKIATSTYSYTNGKVSENVGRKPPNDWGEVHSIYLTIMNAQLAAGTSFEVWGVE